MKQTYLLLLSFVILFSACKKSAPNGNNNSPAISIQAVMPSTGGAGNSVYISGVNFDKSIANNIVKFNGVTSKVMSLSISQVDGSVGGLVVSVPVGATTGKVTVTINSQTATSATDFHIATVSTMAGNGTAGYLDGNSTSAQFNNPAGIAVDGQNTIYVADKDNSKIRKISPSGTVTTLATSVPLDRPTAITVDSSGNLYVTEHQSVVKITPAGTVITILTIWQYSFDPTNFFPTCITREPDGNLLIVNSYLYTMFRIYPSSGPQYLPMPKYIFGTISSITTNSSGDVYISASAYPTTGAPINSSLFRISSNTDGTYGLIPVSVLASPYTDFPDGPLANYRIGLASGMCTDDAPSLYFASNQRVLKIYNNPSWTPMAASGTAEVTILAGNGVSGHVDGDATVAEFSNIQGMAKDKSGNFYVTDGNYIRKIVP